MLQASTYDRIIKGVRYNLLLGSYQPRLKLPPVPTSLWWGAIVLLLLPGSLSVAGLYYTRCPSPHKHFSLCSLCHPPTAIRTLSVAPVASSSTSGISVDTERPVMYNIYLTNGVG